MSGVTTSRPSGGPDSSLRPRERILAAASDLFYRHGIRAVGVDAIAEAADTNKMTLYRHFSSKDVLVAEYLQKLADQADAGWEELERAYPGNPRAQIEAWIEHACAEFGKPSERGCPLANAAVELPEKDHPARRVIEAHKSGQRERLARLCEAAGLSDSENLADEVFLLLEGARVSLQSVGPDGPSSRLHGMVKALICSHAPRHS